MAQEVGDESNMVGWSVNDSTVVIRIDSILIG
jgi:hypothetical protein